MIYVLAILSIIIALRFVSKDEHRLKKKALKWDDLFYQSGKEWAEEHMPKILEGDPDTIVQIEHSILRYDCISTYAKHHCDAYEKLGDVPSRYVEMVERFRYPTCAQLNSIDRNGHFVRAHGEDGTYYDGQYATGCGAGAQLCPASEFHRNASLTPFWSYSPVSAEQRDQFFQTSSQADHWSYRKDTNPYHDERAGHMIGFCSEVAIECAVQCTRCNSRCPHRVAPYLGMIALRNKTPDAFEKTLPDVSDIRIPTTPEYRRLENKCRLVYGLAIVDFYIDDLQKYLENNYDEEREILQRNKKLAGWKWDYLPQITFDQYDDWREADLEKLLLQRFDINEKLAAIENGADLDLGDGITVAIDGDGGKSKDLLHCRTAQCILADEGK